MLRADGGPGVASRLRPPAALKAVFVTYCCKKKSRVPGKIPAIQRYDSDRIRIVARIARTAGWKFLILSGKFGLIPPTTPIPWYDHRLTEAGIPAMARRIAHTFRRLRPGLVVFLTENPGRDPFLRPYLAAVAGGALAAGVPVSVVAVPGALKNERTSRS